MKLHRIKLIHSIALGGKEDTCFTSLKHTIVWHDGTDVIEVTHQDSKASQCTLKHNVISFLVLPKPEATQEPASANAPQERCSKPAVKPTAKKTK